jgi:hypothetical protein
MALLRGATPYGPVALRRSTQTPGIGVVTLISYCAHIVTHSHSGLRF